MHYHYDSCCCGGGGGLLFLYRSHNSKTAVRNQSQCSSYGAVRIKRCLCLNCAYLAMVLVLKLKCSFAFTLILFEVHKTQQFVKTNLTVKQTQTGGKAGGGGGGQGRQTDRARERSRTFQSWRFPPPPPPLTHTQFPAYIQTPQTRVTVTLHRSHPCTPQNKEQAT